MRDNLDAANEELSRIAYKVSRGRRVHTVCVCVCACVRACVCVLHVCVIICLTSGHEISEWKRCIIILVFFQLKHQEVDLQKLARLEQERDGTPGRGACPVAGGGGGVAAGRARLRAEAQLAADSLEEARRTAELLVLEKESVEQDVFVSETKFSVSHRLIVVCTKQRATTCKLCLCSP